MYMYTLSGSISMCVYVWPANTHIPSRTAWKAKVSGEKQAACTWLDCCLRRRKLMPLTFSVTCVPCQWREISPPLSFRWAVFSPSYRPRNYGLWLIRFFAERLTLSRNIFANGFLILSEMKMKLDAQGTRKFCDVCMLSTLVALEDFFVKRDKESLLSYSTSFRSITITYLETSFQGINIYFRN